MRPLPTRRGVPLRGAKRTYVVNTLSYLVEYPSSIPRYMSAKIEGKDNIVQVYPHETPFDGVVWRERSRSNKSTGIIAKDFWYQDLAPSGNHSFLKI